MDSYMQCNPFAFVDSQVKSDPLPASRVAWVSEGGVVEQMNQNHVTLLASWWP